MNDDSPHEPRVQFREVPVPRVLFRPPESGSAALALAAATSAAFGFRLPVVFVTKARRPVVVSAGLLLGGPWVASFASASSPFAFSARALKPSRALTGYGRNAFRSSCFLVPMEENRIDSGWGGQSLPHAPASLRSKPASLPSLSREDSRDGQSLPLTTKPQSTLLRMASARISCDSCVIRISLAECSCICTILSRIFNFSIAACRGHG